MEEGQKRIHWVKWNLALNSLVQGDLGIGSLDAFNLRLLCKWKWRFSNESEALWVKVLKFFHGEGGGFSGGPRIPSGGGVWQKIVGSINHFHEYV